MSVRLYLIDTATASPFPTTSKKLSTTNNASEVTLGPGEFDQGFPGNTDCGQWNPSSPIADTTAAAEIDNTGASLGTTRQGFLYDVDLTGRTMKAGVFDTQLRLRANQGSGTAGRVVMRATIVTGSSGTWVTAANLLTTAITGETSHSTGQNGWRSQTNARLTVTSTAANFTSNIAVAGTSTEHTFTSGQRLLIELGFGDGDSATDRTWRLDYNTANSFIDIPDLVDRVSVSMSGSSTVTTDLTAQPTQIAATIAGTSTVTPAIAGKIAAAVSIAGTSTVSAALDGTIPLAVSLAGSSTSSGTLTGDGELRTVIDGTSTVSGTLIGRGSQAVVIAGTSTCTATCLGRGALATLIAGVGTCSGTLTAAGAPPSGQISVAIAGTSTLSAILAPQGFLKSYWLYMNAVAIHKSP